MNTNAAGAAAAGGMVAAPGNAAVGGGVHVIVDIYQHQLQSIIDVINTLQPASPGATADAGSQAVVSTSGVHGPVQDIHNMVAEITRLRAQVAMSKPVVIHANEFTDSEIRAWITGEVLSDYDGKVENSLKALVNLRKLVTSFVKAPVVTFLNNVKLILENEENMRAAIEDDFKPSSTFGIPNWSQSIQSMNQQIKKLRVFKIEAWKLLPTSFQKNQKDPIEALKSFRKNYNSYVTCLSHCASKLDIQDPTVEILTTTFDKLMSGLQIIGGKVGAKKWTEIVGNLAKSPTIPDSSAAAAATSATQPDELNKYKDRIWRILPLSIRNQIVKPENQTDEGFSLLVGEYEYIQPIIQHFKSQLGLAQMSNIKDTNNVFDKWKERLDSFKTELGVATYNEIPAAIRRQLEIRATAAPTAPGPSAAAVASGATPAVTAPGALTAVIVSSMPGQSEESNVIEQLKAKIYDMDTRILTLQRENAMLKQRLSDGDYESSDPSRHLRLHTKLWQARICALVSMRLLSNSWNRCILVYVDGMWN